MPNAIKYSTSPQTLALKKGNFWIGTGDSDKGPTSNTDYWNGYNPATGGYTIYLNKSSNGPSIYAPANDSELISFTNLIALTSFTTSADCLDWFAGQTDKMVFNIEYPRLLTNGLTLNVDAGFTPSYPTTWVNWYDISSTESIGTLVNFPLFSTSYGGSLLFNGTDNYVSLPKQTSLVSASQFSVSAWVKRTTSSSLISIWQGPSTTNDVALKLGSTGAFFEVGNSSNAFGFVANTSVIWQNIAMVYDGTQSGNSNRLKGYIDGVPQTLVYTGTIPATSGTTDSPFLIGNTGGHNTAGYVSSIQVYNRALSDSEIFQNYEALTRTDDDPDATAYILAAGFTNTDLIEVINNFYIDLKTTGLYSKIRTMKLNLTDSTNNTTSLSQCSIDGINPASATSVYFNAPTANYSGVTYNGTTQYARMSYNPGTDAALGLDNTALFGYAYATSSYLSWAQRSGGSNNIGVLSSGTSVQNFINDAATIQTFGLISNDGGFIGASRLVASTKHIFRNIYDITETGTNTTGRADLDLVEGARTLDGTTIANYYNIRAQFMMVSQGLTVAEVELIEPLVNNLQGSVDTIFSLSGTSARKRY